MKNYGSYSFWLETCGDDLAPRPALDGSTEVDVAILGAGYTGLWTAWSLLEREPGLRVALVESEIAGFGASGRNGGWCYSGMSVGPGEMARRHGVEAARGTALAMVAAVEQVERVDREEGIGAVTARAGGLEVARRPWQVARVEAGVEEYRKIGLEDKVVVLDRAQLEERLRVPGGVMAAWKPAAITIQPAILARGLARAVERKGAVIYERTRVLDYRGDEMPTLVTDRGEVRARRAIVLAGEAYLSQLDRLRRHVIPLTSNMVVTEPLPQSFWDEVGWQGRELVGGSGLAGSYIQRTGDDRIALGPYRTRYPFLSRVTDALDLDDDVFAHARRAALEWFPRLRDFRFTHEWGGVFGMPRDQMPTMGFNPRTKVAMAFGYSGSGVSTAALSGRVLGDLITGHESEVTRLPMASHKPRLWEPEPLRWTGVTYVQRSHMALQEKIERDGKVPARKTIAQHFYDR